MPAVFTARNAANSCLCGGCSTSHRLAIQIAAYINDQFTTKKILDHLGLSPPEVERPPPDTRNVPVDHEGREIHSLLADELSAP